MKATLTYHSIDDSGSPISTPLETFKAHARWLASGRVRVLPLSELAAHPDSGGDAVAVTFDDGFLNVREEIERLLGDGVPVTIFVVTGHVGATNAWGGRTHSSIPTLPLLDWSDLEYLVARGVSIEGHTRTHPDLTSLPEERVEAELQACDDGLYRRLGRRSTHLAYPYGEVNDTVAERATRYFRCGHTTDFRVMSAGDLPMRLPRLDTYYFRNPGTLEAWGTPEFVRRLGWIRMRRLLSSRLVSR